MLMTTNTLWTPISSENLADLAGLTEFDAQLLAGLEPHAAAAAPAFQEAVFSRLLQNFCTSPLLNTNWANPPSKNGLFTCFATHKLWRFCTHPGNSISPTFTASRGFPFGIC